MPLPASKKGAKAPNAPFDIQSIAVFTDGSRYSFRRFAKREDAVIKVTGATVAASEVGGFEISIFDNQQRWNGFIEALKYLHERDDDIFYSGSALGHGIWGVIVGSRDWEDKPEAWIDMRGDASLRP